jgi:hypothetical protein
MSAEYKQVHQSACILGEAANKSVRWNVVCRHSYDNKTSR